MRCGPFESREACFSQRGVTHSGFSVRKGSEAQKQATSVGCGGQNRFGILCWGGFGEFTTHFRTDFCGDWDVHWGYDLDFDPYGHVYICCWGYILQRNLCFALGYAILPVGFHGSHPVQSLNGWRGVVG